MDSFNNLVSMLKPAVVMLQETKIYRKGTINPNAYGIFTLQVPRGGVDSTNPLENPLRVVFVQFFFNPAKTIYNCRSHAKGESQEFKIEEIEEL